jgi:hypothetical protein
MRAILLCFLVACGGGGGGNTPGDDAPPADGGVDVPDDAAPLPTKIRVIVRLETGQGAFGQKILFQRDDDSVIATTTTDGQGVVELDVSGIPTSNVSLLAAGPNNTKVVWVYLGAKAGDVLEIGPALAPEEKPVGMVTLKLPPTQGTFDVVSRCRTEFPTAGGQAPTITLPPCGTPTNFLVRSGQGSFYTPLTPLTNGQTLDLSAQTYRTTQMQTVQITSATQAQRALVAAGAFDYGLTLSPRDSRNIVVTGGNALTTYTLNDHPAVPVTTELSFLATPQDSRGWHRRAVPGDQTFDWAQIGLPLLSNKLYANGMLTWTETGTGGDYTWAQIKIRNGGVDRMTVQIAGPHTAAALRVPVYPDAAFNPMTGDTPLFLSMFVIRSTGGWDKARSFAHRYDFHTAMDWLGIGDFAYSY